MWFSPNQAKVIGVPDRLIEEPGRVSPGYTGRRWLFVFPISSVRPIWNGSILEIFTWIVGEGDYLFLTVSEGLFSLGPYLDPYHPLSQDFWRERGQSYLGEPHRTSCRCACIYTYLWYTNQIFLSQYLWGYSNNSQP